MESENRADGHVCSVSYVRSFDNFLRPLIHKPKKLFGPFVRPGMRVMDVGCGAGFASLGLARLVGDEGQVVAVDLQQGMLDILGERAARAELGHRIALHRCERDALGLAGTFDFANAFYMVHELPDQRRFFAEIRTLLAPEGRLFVAEPWFHVTKKKFAAMRFTARDTGLVEIGSPKVRFSHAIVFAPGNG